LGIDPDELLQTYDAQSTPSRTRIRAARGEPPPKPKGKDPNAINIQPLSSEKLDTRVRYGVSYIALSLLAIPLIIIFYFIYSAYAGPNNPPIVPTQTPRVPTVTALPTEILGQVGTPVVPTVAVTATVPITGTQVTTETAVASTPIPAEGVTLKITTFNDAWVRVTVDGEVAYEGRPRARNGSGTARSRFGFVAGGLPQSASS
jgi:cytoskeletal protein RodZ